MNLFGHRPSSKPNEHLDPDEHGTSDWTWWERIAAGEERLVTWEELFGPVPPEPPDWKAEGERWLAELNAKNGK